MNFKLIDIISLVSGIFPVLAAIANYRDLDKTLKLLAVFFLVSFVCDISLLLLSLAGIKNNMPLIHCFIVVTVVAYGTVYYRAFFDPLLKKIALILSVLTLLIVLYYALHIFVYPSESNTVSGVLFIILSLLYFYQLLNRQEFVHIEKQGFFWINAGILFYFSVNLFLFMLFRKIISQHLEEYYIIHSITNIIANLLYSVGLLCKPQTAA